VPLLIPGLLSVTTLGWLGRRFFLQHK
jgi:hypothetical protein